MHDFMKDNVVRRFLKRRGYTTVAFSSGYVITELPDADLYLAPGWFYDEFPNAVLDMTPLGAFFHSLDPAENTRTRLLFMFDALKAMPERPGPKFVFAHFLGPHRPIVFGPNGESVYPERLWRHPWLSGRFAQEYRKYYRDEVIFLNRKLEDAIDSILAKSARPPIIILQGDTGPCSLLADPDRPTPAALRERMRILNGYYLEGESDNALYPSITPVNSFRVVLNHSFGTRYPMLPDENYYSTVWTLYRLRRVTDIVGEGSTPAKP
jgi:hypothetical protein